MSRDHGQARDVSEPLAAEYLLIMTAKQVGGTSVGLPTSLLEAPS